MDDWRQRFRSQSVDNCSYGASNMSAITGSRVSDKVDSKANVAVIESLNKDPGTYSFVLDGKSMFLLRQYNYSTVDLIPSKVIGADTTWSKDEVYPSGIITKGANPHSAVIMDISMSVIMI